MTLPPVWHRPAWYAVATRFWSIHALQARPRDRLLLFTDPMSSL
ncbi:hypothetical protein [Sorangium sp. So ce233]